MHAHMHACACSHTHTLHAEYGGGPGGALLRPACRPGAAGWLRSAGPQPQVAQDACACEGRQGGAVRHLKSTGLLT
eukprot:1137065-Pelagomonas_calceolata.AAC.9